MSKHLTFDGTPLTIEDVVAISQQRVDIRVSDDQEFVDRIEQGATLVDSVLEKQGQVYGITTGYGDSVDTGVAHEDVVSLPINLTRFHGCGLGAHFSEQETRAILAVRLCSLCRGYSGVSYALLKRLALLLQEDILPLIPEEGSVGASGDLTPLSYIAGALIGERDVRFQGRVRRAKDVYSTLGIDPYVLRPKEALALMNGTAVMTAIACLNLYQSAYMVEVSSRITSMMMAAVAGNPYHFDVDLHAVKPHQGQQQVAAWILSDITFDGQQAPTQTRLQDRYSLRCAPHVIGVVRDCLPFLRHTIENELNSANDNPIVDPLNQRIHHGGHFYGGHIAMAMDTLKTQVANLADLHDRQVALLLDTRSNNGLAANLTAAQGRQRSISHGFKAVQIGCSAWTAEALKLTVPASVFSRSTECHNQDKVSMGTIASRDCRRVIELTQQVVAAALLASAHGVSLRQQLSGEDRVPLTPAVIDFVNAIIKTYPLLIADRPLESELRALVVEVQRQQWRLY